MKLAIVISNDDPETIWNAFRFANFSISKSEKVRVFLLGKGVDYEGLSTERFDLLEQAKKFVESENAEILACGTCLKIRHQESTGLCPVSTMDDLYELVKESDKILTF